MNTNSHPIRILLNDEDKEVIARAGVMVLPETTVRLDERYLDAVDKIVEHNSRPGVRFSRLAAIRVALHGYCKGLSAKNGGRYSSFSDLVRDSLDWYAAGL